MKVPLRYQVSEYDCGPISLFNAFNFVLEREEIPAILLKKIWEYTLDCMGDNGEVGEGGTSRKAMQKFVEWFNNYNKNGQINVRCDYLKGSVINLDEMKKALSKNGCILARCYQSSEHYVIITKITKKYAYLFDPYYINKKVDDTELKIIHNNYFSYNRRITLQRLFDSNKKDFALGNVKNSECILIYQKR